MLQPEEEQTGLRKDGAERRTITDHITYFDSLVEAKPLDIPMGRSRCSNLSDVMLVTTVGSGIGVCIHEPGIQAGGLGHFVLPPDVVQAFPGISDKEPEIKTVIDRVLGSMVETLLQLGGQPSRMRVKLFGGADLEDTPPDSGRKLAILVKEFLLRNGINVVSEDIGKPMGRRIQFLPVTGQGMRRLLKRAPDIVELSAAEREFFGIVEEEE
jgi:chemotaxis protein CheD